MAKENKTPPENMNEMAAESVEQARGAMENYLKSCKTACQSRLWLKQT